MAIQPVQWSVSLHPWPSQSSSNFLLLEFADGVSGSTG
jgi:hypothetical protein